MNTEDHDYSDIDKICYEILCEIVDNKLRKAYSAYENLPDELKDNVQVEMA